MISSTFCIIFVFLFLIFWNIFLILILCIIILDLSHRKIVVKTTFLIQKLLNVSIFLLLSKITLKIISFLNFLIFTIFLHAVSVLSMFHIFIKTIIFAALIFCIRFISYSFLIHVIIFIFVFNFRFEEALILRRKSAEIAIVDCLIVIFIQLFSSIVFFVFSIIFFSFLVISFSLVICLSKYSLIIFVLLALLWRVASFIILKNFVIIVYNSIFDKFFFFDS